MIGPGLEAKGTLAAPQSATSEKNIWRQAGKGSYGTQNGPGQCCRALLDFVTLLSQPVGMDGLENGIRLSEATYCTRSVLDITKSHPCMRSKTSLPLLATRSLE